MSYQFLENIADIQILVEELSLEKAFGSSALALREIMLDFDKIKIKSNKSKIISVEGKDIIKLFYNFLEEFIYLLDAENFIFSEIEDLEIVSDANNFVLTAKLSGDKASNYKFINKVKAVTYNQMKIDSEKSGKTKIEFVLDV
jgi:SHS2 domain-containing protein